MLQQPPSPADRQKGDRALASVLDVLLKKGVDGKPLYGDEQLRVCVALLFVQVSSSLPQSAAAARTAAGAAQTLGIVIDGAKKDNAAQIGAKIAAAIASLAPALRSDLERALRDLALGDLSEAGARLAHVVGAAPSKKPVGAEPAPAGSVRGGLAVKLGDAKKSSGKSNAKKKR